jgi:dephospho-CoA kinase
MKVFGLTGGIASGKSYVTSLFSQYHIPIIDADVIVATLLSQALIIDKITALFSQHALNTQLLTSNGLLNKSILRKIIFNESEQRKKLEKLLHPMVFKEIRDELNALKYTDTDYCIVCIPLLVETASHGSHDFLDKIIVIECTEQQQIQRLTQRDNINPKQAQQIIQTQANAKSRAVIADFILSNTGNIEQLQAQVKILHQTIQQK